MKDDEEMLTEELEQEEELEENEPEEPVEPDEPAEPDESEAIEAKKFGHLSKEDWIAKGNDPVKYKTPAEFNKTAKVIDQLYSLKKKVDQRDREIQALIDYQQRTAQREFERAKKDIESQLVASKNDMDMEGVARYTKELVRLEDNENLTHAQHAQQLQRQAQESFIERNQHWFNDRNPDLKARAIEIDNELKGIYPNATYEELAQKIEARMQYEHPERVGGTVRNAPRSASANSSVNKSAVNKSSVGRTFQSLSQDLKDTYNATKRIVESRGDREYTQADFINQLKKDGELK